MPERSYTFELTLNETQMGWLVNGLADEAIRTTGTRSDFFQELVEQLESRKDPEAELERIAEEHESHDDRLMNPSCPLCQRGGRNGVRNEG